MTITNELPTSLFSSLTPYSSSQKPLKHEWVELISWLSTSDDPHMREIGLAELKKCAERDHTIRNVIN